MRSKQSKRLARSRWEIDCAIHRCLAVLGSHRPAKEAFQRIVTRARAGSTLLRPDLNCGRAGWIDAVRTVTGLSALSRECRYWRSTDWNWAHTTGSRWEQFRSLASHVFGDCLAPMCLAPAWFEGASDQILRQRKWFRHLAAGHSLRGLDLPVRVTKGMAEFLQFAPSHLPIEKALRWSQLREGGMSYQAALDEVDPGRHSIRRRAGTTGTGWKRLGIPGFHLSESYAREWHARTWEIRELLSSDELDAEGAALHHCVALYAAACKQRRKSIWSLRCTDHRGANRSELTISVNPRFRAIVEARGKWNKRPTSMARRLMLAWARQAGLRVEEWV